MACSRRWPLNAQRLSGGSHPMLFELISEMSGPGEHTRGEEFCVPWE
jgi:hypothetical protein